MAANIQRTILNERRRFEKKKICIKVASEQQCYERKTVNRLGQVRKSKVDAKATLALSIILAVEKATFTWEKQGTIFIHTYIEEDSLYRR